MKMFRTVNMDVINDCRLYFDFMLPSELLRKFNSCYSIVCHILALGNVCDNYLLFIS